MKVLVTGSRDWANQAVVWNALTDLDVERSISVVVHGNAKGADVMADAWAFSMDCPTEVYAITSDEWEEHGRAAGPLRNVRMVDQSDPDIVLAFIKNYSRGSTHCMEYAHKQGIPVKVYRDDGF